MPIRRQCDPTNVKKIWDAIRSINLANQPCELTRIFRFFQRTQSCSASEVEQYIKQCVKDGLIKKSSSESSSATFTITDQELPQFDGKDWYCFECHLAGDVVLCANCFRVFHYACTEKAKSSFKLHKKSSSLRYNSTSTPSINSSIDASDGNFDTSHSSTADNLANYNFEESLCFVCNINNIDDWKVDKADINHLLRFVLNRIRAWLPNTITHTMAEEDRPSWLTDSELTWRANQLFFEHRDMSVIEVNLNTETYNGLSEFLADVLTVHHNVAIFHGIESQEYQAAEFMVRDTLHDITEIRNCIYCYKHSNEKVTPKWFALPCRNPHRLVWAKQKGFPYWPAKVINETATHCDVRFFGGKHERALIHKTYVKDIAIPIEQLKVKLSQALAKSIEELELHQTLLIDPQALEKVIAESKPKRMSRKSISSISTPSKSHKKGKTVKPTKEAHSSSLPVSIETASTSNQKETSINSATPSTSSSTNAKRKSSLREVNRTPNKKQKDDPDKSSGAVISGNVIHISDGEEETDYSFRGSDSNNLSRFDESAEPVSSSTENDKSNSQDGLHKLDQPYSDSVEKMRRQVEKLKNPGEIVKCAMDMMQAEIDKLTEEHNGTLRGLFESHNAQISETKKKQWCYNCEQDAIYHCCWNTAYCSQTCQQQHWQAEHKKVCRRKRQA